ncbi:MULTISPECIES: HpcH/HpaI aldolase family protein [Pseudomonadota]|uniref:HpcH/HpaI aldolase family protein n=1 Tax=Pseudomonadota TaxID=1224 RepID=UPI0025832035|nr:aldolase/citrate lyase family protein [Advenella sp.]MDD3758722.1 aldolase/citrate lyase family protein [Advenella sp.]
MTSRFIETLKVPGSCQFGTWVKLDSPETIECLALAGFNFIAIDMEHAPLTFQASYRNIVIAQGLGLKVLVRLPDSSGAYAQRILDCGADGVLIPRVRSEQEARDVMTGMIFSPVGHRGLGITSRAGHWGLKPTAQYVEEGNNHVLRIPQLEDPGALGDVEKILAVPGVNAIFVGPGDLALSTGKPASHPDNSQLITNLINVANRLNIPCGTAVGDVNAAIKAKENGFNFVMISNDISIFAKSSASMINQLKS